MINMQPCAQCSQGTDFVCGTIYAHFPKYDLLLHYSHLPSLSALSQCSQHLYYLIHSKIISSTIKLKRITTQFFTLHHYIMFHILKLLHSYFHLVHWINNIMCTDLLVCIVQRFHIPFPMMLYGCAAWCCDLHHSCVLLVTELRSIIIFINTVLSHDLSDWWLLLEQWMGDTRQSDSGPSPGQSIFYLFTHHAHTLASHHHIECMTKIFYGSRKPHGWWKWDQASCTNHPHDWACILHH